MTGERPPTVPPPSAGTPDSGVPAVRYLVIARVVRPHGLNGAMRCEIVTEHPEHLPKVKRVYLGEPRRMYRVWQVHLEGDEQARTVLLTLNGVRTREAAEAFRGEWVWIHESDAVPLKPGEYYAYQLVGVQVSADDGQLLGELVEVMTTGANDVYVVRGPRGEILIPAISAVVREIDVPGKRVIVHLMPGLLPDA